MYESYSILFSTKSNTLFSLLVTFYARVRSRDTYARGRFEKKIVPIQVLPGVTPPILAVYNEFPVDCIAITGKQIAPSISQIAGSENEISQSGLLVRATFVPIVHAHDATRARPTHVRAFQRRAMRVCTPVDECTSNAVELAARGSSRMNQPGCAGDFYNCVMKLNNR